MCIIAIKNKGISLPDETTLKAMFENNPDGAGFMYAYNGSVFIEKGFMSYEEFKRGLVKVSEKYDISALPLVMHFRIATSGNVDGGTTHPFPVSSKRKILRKTSFTTNLAIVHNGIIPISAPKNTSDTMEYVAKKLTTYKRIQKDFYKHKYYLKRIEKEIKSKMVFLDSSGYITKIGDFITEDDGMIYSNSSYMERHYYYNFDKLFGYYPTAMLCPIDGYIVCRDGNIIDADEGLYLMDKHGNVYEYSFALDMALKMDADAYAYSGMPYVYDENEAMYFDVEI